MSGRALAREAAIFLFFTAAALALTWPLATHLPTAVPDAGDPLLNTWILDWVCHALTHSPLHLYDAPMYYPGLYPLAYSENMIGIAIFALPFHLAGFSALTVYNLMVLLGFAFAGYGASVLARTVARSIPASIVAGLFFGFVSFKFDHLSHLQIIWSGWLPLLLAALMVFWRRPDTPRAALLSAAFLMNGLTNIYFLLFAGFAIAVTIAFLAAAAPHRDWRAWVRLIAALAIASLVLLPVLMPYRSVSKRYNMQRIPEEVRSNSATWDDWLRVTSRSALYGRFMDPDIVRTERVLFPGALCLVLAGYAMMTMPRSNERSSGRAAAVLPATIIVLDSLILIALIATWIGAVTARWRLQPGGHVIVSLDNSGWPLMIAIVLLLVRLALRLPSGFTAGENRCLQDAVADSRFPITAWAATIWIAIGVLGSFGMNSFMHAFLYDHVEPFRALRAVGRWAILAYTGLTVWVALGASLLIERRPSRWRPAAAALLIASAVGDVMPKIIWEQMVPEVAPFYRWLKQQRVGPVLELPMHTDDGVEFRYLLSATVHHVPIVNGTSGFEPPLHQALRSQIESGRMTRAFTSELERAGCRVVVVHVDRLAQQTATVLDWLQSEVAGGRLAPLRRFDSGMSGDYVLAVTKTLPDWSRFADSGFDRAGHQPAENFERMLRRERTYTASTFGRLEVPTTMDTIYRELHVSGWALSRRGIRRVDVLVDGGKLRLTATPYDRHDVQRAFPWYPQVPHPGFDLVIPKRPKGIPRETDIQVEIVDGDGGTTRLTDTPIVWH